MAGQPAAPGAQRRWPPVAWSGPQHGVPVAAVRAAPSILNTQPWSLRMLPDRVELHADPRRRLDRLDPDARHLQLSCGAAAMNLELAMHHLGYRPQVSLLPDRQQPWHVAVGTRPGVRAQRVGRPDQLAALAEVLAVGGRRLAADREACAELARWVRTPGIPQLLIRLGWASGRAPRSPRRAPDAFVTDPLRDL